MRGTEFENWAKNKSHAKKASFVSFLLSQGVV